jgi:hypothetical protein
LPDGKGPRLLYPSTFFPFFPVAPTTITPSASAGEVKVPAPGPLFPALLIIVRPSSHAALQALASLPVPSDAGPVPQEQLANC